MNPIERLTHRLASFFNGIAASAVLAMMTLTCLDVVLRLVRHPIVGNYEIVGLLGAVFVSFSLARTTLDRGTSPLIFWSSDQHRYLCSAVHGGVSPKRMLCPGPENQR